MVVALAVAAVVALVALVPAARASHEAPVAAIDDAPRQLGSSRPHRWWRGRGPHPAGTVGWGVRTFAARPFRTATSVGATALAVVAAVVTLSIDHAIDGVLAHPSLSGDPYDATFQPAHADAVAARLDALPEVGSWFTTQDETVDWDSGQVHARALGGDVQTAGYVIGGGHLPSAPGEAMVAYGLVDDGVAVGDHLTLRAGDRTGTFTVVGWYRDTEDTGRIVALRDRLDAPLFGDVDVDYQVTAAPGVSDGELSRALSTLGGTVRLNRSDGAAMAPFRTAMAAMTALLAAVALAHLLATALATARERAHSTDILRTVGASRRRLAASAAVAGALRGRLRDRGRPRARALAARRARRHDHVVGRDRAGRRSDAAVRGDRRIRIAARPAVRRRLGRRDEHHSPPSPGVIWGAIHRRGRVDRTPVGDGSSGAEQGCQPALELGALALVGGQGERGPVLLDRLGDLPGAGEEVGSRGRQQAVVTEPWTELVERGEPGAGAVADAQCDRPVELDHRRRGERQQLVVEVDDPVPPRDLRRLCDRVSLGDRCLQHVGPAAAGCAELAAGLGDLDCAASVDDPAPRA